MKRSNKLAKLLGVYSTYLLFSVITVTILKYIFASLMLITNILILQLAASILSLMLHEGGHLIAAKLYGIHFDLKTLVIMPFGISLELKDQFLSPLQNITVSLAGPLVNLFIFCFFAIFPDNPNCFIYCDMIIKINFVLFGFNMLPMGFLDGGRILGAILSAYISFNKSLKVISVNGIILGLLMIYSYIHRGISMNGIPFFILGLFFIYSSLKVIRVKNYLIIENVLSKNYNSAGARSLSIKKVCYTIDTKLLDIIKNFCFNKYYVIHIIENGKLRYNINEAELVCIFCKHGNIKLEECLCNLKKQEVKHG